MIVTTKFHDLSTPNLILQCLQEIELFSQKLSKVSCTTYSRTELFWNTYHPPPFIITQVSEKIKQGRTHADRKIASELSCTPEGKIEENS